MAQEIESQTVQVTVEDGTKMNLYVSRPKGAKKAPGLIVIQEAFGVNHHIKEMTKRFAHQGYVAAAPELFHRTAPPNFEGPYDFQAIAPHFQALTTEGLTADGKATFDWLKSQPDVDPNSISSIGYCMGGRTAFLFNGTLPLKNAVSYYGGRIAPDLLSYAEKQSGPILFIWGGLDKHITEEQINQVTSAMKKAGKPYGNVTFSYADHAFSNEDRPTMYSEKATREAWALSLAFLRSF